MVTGFRIAVHPIDVVTLVAHEPPINAVLPDAAAAERARAAFHDDPLLSKNSWAISDYRPDAEALTAAPTRIVIAVGEERAARDGDRFLSILGHRYAALVRTLGAHALILQPAATAAALASGEREFCIDALAIGGTIRPALPSPPRMGWPRTQRTGGQAHLSTRI
ncbi:hypothetical protein [Micromonospora purpureochromogenes]|uniref:Uncharacterized protein n=1 Tax=Micromonospora purpureochromogenes TaxID=47872 RepID=A0ABX2RPX2_9ACTN|nr:hypothetical protein [Micromonospora purpureochromogenes]NYF58577.1 hypothetical protein [Micromonospora purpureochromogenes]